MAGVIATVLAHQGGRDEILFVLAPLLAFAGLLLVARKRIGEMEAVDGAAPAGDEPPAEDEPPAGDAEARDVP